MNPIQSPKEEFYWVWRMEWSCFPHPSCTFLSNPYLYIKYYIQHTMQAVSLISAAPCTDLFLPLTGSSAFSWAISVLWRKGITLTAALTDWHSWDKTWIALGKKRRKILFLIIFKAIEHNKLCFHKYIENCSACSESGSLVAFPPKAQLKSEIQWKHLKPAEKEQKGTWSSSWTFTLLPASLQAYDMTHTSQTRWTFPLPWVLVLSWLTGFTYSIHSFIDYPGYIEFCYFWSIHNSLF